MVCIFDSSNAKPETPPMDVLYWSWFRMRVIGRCVFEIRKIAVSFLWLSLPGHYRVTDEILLAETT